MKTGSSAFVFVGYEEHIAEGWVSFFYNLHHGEERIRFAETLRFEPVSISSEQAKKYHLILNNLLLILGISYWKVYCPKNILLTPFTLTKDQARFWDTLYTKGLGQLFYENNINFNNLIHFPYQETPLVPAETWTRTNRSLVQLGGGKDSIVSAEALKQYKKGFSLFVLNEKPIHKYIATLIGKNIVKIKREIDPQLFELNKRADANNGHVPISAIYAWTGLLASALYDYSFIVASNEESANYGNITYLGEEINHQWSKSYEFEQLFQAYVSCYVCFDMSYFSLLRPIRELKVIEIFSHYTQYFRQFSSCNTNFKLQADRGKPEWCGHCAKCAFVFLGLRAFLPKAEVQTIFGKNLFTDGNLLPLYRELLGLEGFKPFECVGTPEESQYALYRIQKQGDYHEDIVLKTLLSEIEFDAKKIDMLETYVNTVSERHSIPREFADVIHAL